MPAYIRLNTPEITKKLEELGYRKSDFGCDECDSIATSVADEKVYIIISQDSFDTINPHQTWNCAGRVDCGTDVKQFFDIVSKEKAIIR